MKFKKLLVCHLDKTYSINIVSKQCFNISPKIESMGIRILIYLLNPLLIITT